MPPRLPKPPENDPSILPPLPSFTRRKPPKPPIPTRVPAYGLHKPTGQARVILQGRHFYLGPYGSPESRQKYARLVAELGVPGNQAAGAWGADDEPAVCEVLDAYWQYAEQYYVKGGVLTDHVHTIKRALSVVRRLYADAPVGDFGPRAFQAVQRTLVADGNCRTYINQVCGTIKRMFKWAAAQELIDVTVYQALATVPGLKRGRTPAREPEPVGPVDDQVIDATLVYLPPVVADMVRFQRLTGCRPGELCSIRPGDIDRSGEVWEYGPGSHKTEHHGRGRIIYIGPNAQEVLLPYLLRAPDAYCFSPAESVARENAEKRARRKTKVQPSQQNRRRQHPKRTPADQYTKDSYCRAVHRAVDRVNRERPADEQIPHWHPNQLRHSRATELRRQFGIEGAQLILGHAKADVTQVYAERDAAAARRIALQTG